MAPRVILVIGTSKAIPKHLLKYDFIDVEVDSLDVPFMVTYNNTPKPIMLTSSAPLDANITDIIHIVTPFKDYNEENETYGEYKATPEQLARMYEWSINRVFEYMKTKTVIVHNIRCTSSWVERSLDNTLNRVINDIRLQLGTEA